MKGLFLFSYDYYEWKDLIAVYDSSEKLHERYVKEDSRYKLVADKLEHEKLADKEMLHYMIIDVECV